MRSARRDFLTLALAGGGVLACLTSCAPLGLPTSIELGGDATGSLRPGLAVPVDLEITNRHLTPIDVADIRVEIASISAPFADDTHPCTTEDYVITQPRPEIAIAVAALSTQRLSDSTLPLAEWPQVQMLDRPVDQDGCRGAELTLRYSASTVAVMGE